MNLPRVIKRRPPVAADDDLRAARQREAQLMRRVAVLADEAALISRQRPIPWHRREKK